MPKMTFVERDGTRREVDAPVGMSVLEIARRHDAAFDGRLGRQVTSHRVEGNFHEPTP